MAVMPGADWRPVASHSGLMTEHLGLVVHVDVGDGSPCGWFANTADQASSTWWAAKSGSIEQYVDSDEAAWTEEAGNFSYNSVETEGYVNEALTDEQIVSVARIFAWGHVTYGWPMQTCDHGGRGLTTHAHYPSGEPDPAWGGHPCPGTVRAAQLPTILAAAEQLVGAGVSKGSASVPTSKPTTDTEDEMRPFLAIANAKYNPPSPPTAPAYPHVGEGSVWIVAGLSRSWVADDADKEALLVEYGQTSCRALSGATLARIPVAKV